MKILKNTVYGFDSKETYSKFLKECYDIGFKFGMASFELALDYYYRYEGFAILVNGNGSLTYADIPFYTTDEDYKGYPVIMVDSSWFDVPKIPTIEAGMAVKFANGDYGLVAKRSDGNIGIIKERGGIVGLRFYNNELKHKISRSANTNIDVIYGLSATLKDAFSYDKIPECREVLWERSPTKKFTVKEAEKELEKLLGRTVEISRGC